MSDQPSNDNIQAARIFSSTTAEDTKAQAEFASAQHFDRDAEFTPQAAQETQEIPQSADFDATLQADLAQLLQSPTPKKRRYLFPLLCLVMLLGVIESAMFIWASWQTSTLLGALYSCVLVVILGVAARFSVREWRGLKRLRDIEQQQQDLQRIQESVQKGEAMSMCQTLTHHLPQVNSVQQGIQAWHEVVQAHHTDQEIIQLFEHHVIKPCDELALMIVRRHATQTSLMVAVSPVALIDMALVLIRSIKMMQDISRCYGVEHGYWSRINLIKQALHNVIFAGTSELLADVGSSFLGFELIGKISTRAVQGLGAGLLTGKLGFKAILQVRPIRQSALLTQQTASLSKQLTKAITEAVELPK